jgi:transcription-repair coupling factor (superfamily II helicase)
MELTPFLKLFGKLAAIDQTASALSQEKVRVHWKGLVGSSKSISAACVAQQVPGHHVFILNDKEEAAYFLNDLEGLFSEDKRILFYPASYRVPYQLEETDNANVVTRAEVLERIANGSNAWVVTYPEALFEKVFNDEEIEQETANSFPTVSNNSSMIHLPQSRIETQTAHTSHEEVEESLSLSDSEKDLIKKALSKHKNKRKQKRKQARGL